MTVQLNKERTENDRLRQDIQELSSIGDRLRDELMIAQRSEAKRASNGNTNSSNHNNNNQNEESEVASLRKELTSTTKSLEDSRRKLTQAKEEVRNMRNLLAKELGEGTSIEEANEGNWRGRAQQIVMLKAKVIIINY